MHRNHKEVIFSFIDRFYRDNGYAPSLAQIGQAVGMSSRSAVQRQIWQLTEDGRLINVGGKYLPAGATVSTDVQMVPVLGTIAAGVPIEAIQELDGYVAYLPKTPGRDKTMLALRVRGDSMIEAGINNGDIVIVEQRPDAENGQIVAAMIDGEATVKTFFQEDGHFRLQPENASMKPIIVDHVEILGHVVAIQRYY